MLRFYNIFSTATCEIMPLHIIAEKDGDSNLIFP